MKLWKCRKHSPAARVFYISIVFSNACRVLSQSSDYQGKRANPIYRSIPKVIPFKLFLDMVLPRMPLARCVDVSVEDLFMSFRFV